MKVSELAALLDCAWEGPDREIHGVAPLESAGPAQLAFVGNRQAAVTAAASTAGRLIVPQDFPGGRTLLRATNPRATFAQAVRRLYPSEVPAPGVHPTALVAESAVVDASATLGSHVTIGEMARVGARTQIGAGSVVGARVSVGADCQIHPNVTLSSDVAIGHRAGLRSKRQVDSLEDWFRSLLVGAIVHARQFRKTHLEGRRQCAELAERQLCTRVVGGFQLHREGGRLGLFFLSSYRLSSSPPPFSSRPRRLAVQPSPPSPQATV